MLTSASRRSWLPAVFSLCLAASLLLLAPQHSWARDGDRGPRPDRRDGGPPPRHDRGPRVVPHLPPGHVLHPYKGNRYYYHGGHYYRPHRQGGYVVVRPPVGLFIAALPVGFATVVLGGVTYYSFADIYYRPAPGGYVVVEPPAGVVVTPAPPPAYTPPETIAAASVMVMVRALNLRGGPGPNFPVVSVVGQGTVLTVLGNAPNWLYVQTPDGIQGWVARQFTQPVGPAPSG